MTLAVESIGLPNTEALEYGLFMRNRNQIPESKLTIEDEIMHVYNRLDKEHRAAFCRYLAELLA